MEAEGDGKTATRGALSECTAAARPYSVALAIWMASSSVLNLMIAATGPKISSLAIFMSIVTSANAVGWMK